MGETPRFQFVWWREPRDWHLRFVRLDPAKTSMAYIYRWSLRIGPLEVRRWSTLRVPPSPSRAAE